MLHVPGMPEGVHVSFSPENLPAPVPAQTALVGAGTPSEALAALIQAHELAYAHALFADTYGQPDAAARKQAEEEAFRALLHTPLHSDADRAAYALAVIERQSSALIVERSLGRDHPMPVAYRNLRFGEHAREPEQMLHLGRPAKSETPTDPILTAIEEQRRLNQEHESLHKVCCGEPNNHPSWVPERPAHAAMWDHWRNVVLNTVPQTAEGCRALAAYALEFEKDQGTGFEEEAPVLLDLIARSPLATSAGEDIAAFAILDAIEREWVAQMAQEHEERNDLSQQADERDGVRIDRKWALLDAAAALPGHSRETRHAKALALSWSVQSDLWRSDWTRDQYRADGRLLLDLMSSLAGQVPASPTTAPKVTDPETPNLDLSGYSVPQLCALFDVYDRAEDQFHTAGWWPKLGDAGCQQVTDEGDRCMALKGAVADELQKRQPGTESDADERAEKLLRRAVVNGDWEGIARLACSLRNEVTAFHGKH